jgi:hypothetical protein
MIDSAHDLCDKLDHAAIGVNTPLRTPISA